MPVSCRQKADFCMQECFVNLGVQYSGRYSRTGSLDDLNNAIQRTEEGTSSEALIFAWPMVVSKVTIHREQGLHRSREVN